MPVPRRRPVGSATATVFLSRPLPLFLPLPVALAMAVTVGGVPAHAQPADDSSDAGVRFATFNASLNRSAKGELIEDLSAPDNRQARDVAQIVQRNRPDVLLVNEFDYDSRGRAAELFQRNYLSKGQGDSKGIDYPYRYTAPSNTGVASGLDLDNDGRAVTEPGEDGYAEDALGFGDFPGQYGMVVYSKHPIDTEKARSFRKFRWADMPGALLPTDPETGEDFYSEEERDTLRLSSKSHWDLPVRTGKHETVHLLAAHPTPPSFDGPEKRNVLRNHDETRFISDYVTPGNGDYIHDDDGTRGGLPPGAKFVIAGDLNADPNDGDGHPEAIPQLLNSPRVTDSVEPRSQGGAEAARLQGGANEEHTGDPASDTGDFADDPGPGNLRLDYVLPSRGLSVRDTEVYWPTTDDPMSQVTDAASDHRLVWLDVG